MDVPEQPGPRTGRVILLTAVALVALGVALSAGALVYTGQSSFCNSCHEMTTRYVSWQRSTHAQAAGCMDCHEDPGTLGEIKAHLNGARYLFVLLTGEGSGSVIRAQVNSESCQECHAAERLPRQIGGHQVEHRAHIAREVSCADCHGNLVHGSLRGSAVQPTMTTCVDCHTRTAPTVMTSCTTCHQSVPARAGVGRLLPAGSGVR